MTRPRNQDCQPDEAEAVQDEQSPQRIGPWPETELPNINPYIFSILARISAPMSSLFQDQIAMFNSFLTRSTSRLQTHEAGVQLRTVLVEFDSYEIALGAYESEAYRKALQALGSAAERDFRIVEGA